jgi:hypothetical protein
MRGLQLAHVFTFSPGGCLWISRKRYVFRIGAQAITEALAVLRRLTRPWRKLPSASSG